DPNSYRFSNSGFDGGGFMSQLAVDSSGTLMAGGDTQGLFRSSTTGSAWTTSNAGLKTTAFRQIADVAPSPIAAHTWYAAVGNANSGALLRSSDDGATWSVKADLIFDGGNLPSKNGHPRATGSLLAFASGGRIFAGTVSGGIMAVTDDATQPETAIP